MSEPTQKKQKPHKWNSRKDAECCIACEKEFKRGDLVYTDCAVNLHVDCLRLYRKQLIELGIFDSYRKKD